MIVVKVEIWSAVTGQKTELARVVIDNIGGTTHLGNYRARSLKGRDEEALDKAMLRIQSTGTQREGKVIGHPRLREHVWNLVAKSLSAMGYGKATAQKIVQSTTLDETQ
jgi:hypothetical protein